MILIAFSSLSSTFVRAELVVTFLTQEANSGTYTTELIKLALEKTRASHGEYQLIIGPEMPHIRRIAFVQQNSSPNSFTLRAYDEKWHASGNLTYVNFPIDLGALGWRICFVSPQSKEKIKTAKSLDDLRNYSIVQGLGWGDNKILRENGFRVIELDGYQSLFQMVASGRADLFCRGFNELPIEYAARKEMGNLIYDESFLLYYKMPYFLYTNKANALAKQRLEKGLEIAYADGSIMCLWLDKFKGSVEFSNIGRRKIFQLKNSGILNLSTDYEKYVIDPLMLKQDKSATYDQCDGFKTLHP